MSLSKSLLEVINCDNMQHQVQNNITLAIHINGVKNMREHFKKSTSFGHSTVVKVADLSAQRDDVTKVIHKRGGQHLHSIEDSHPYKTSFVVILA